MEQAVVGNLAHPRRDIPAVPNERGYLCFDHITETIGRSCYWWSVS